MVRLPTSAHDDLDAVQLLDNILRRALAIRASDIHLEPKRDMLRVRFRVDGVLVHHGQYPLAVAAPLTSRVKVLGRMDMTERRVPQDGHITTEMGGGAVHVRASTFPGQHGEKVVLRILVGHKVIPVEELGMEPDDLAKIRTLVQRSSGLILVCGPTGSGKTSTLYSLLQVMNTAERNIVTLEDPIEVELPDITQGQTNVKQGFTFATGLRAVLRQDPDVILVGEMRDPETAQIALQASLTGHLVLSTLHTSDTLEAVTRLIDLGVEPWIVANALLAVIAQRLVRLLCTDCAEHFELTTEFKSEKGETLIDKGVTLKRMVGCQRCYATGFWGRVGIFETLELNDEIRELIKSHADKRTYEEVTHRGGRRPLRQVGLERAKTGITTLEEVLRVT